MGIGNRRSNGNRGSRRLALLLLLGVAIPNACGCLVVLSWDLIQSG